MTEVFFYSQMMKLSRTFGEKFYTADRTDIIWNSVRNLGEDWFTKTVTKLISSSRPPPLPEQILELARIERENFTSAPEVRGTCGECNDGVIMAEKLDTNTSPFAFRCSCQFGRQRKERFPVWAQDQGFKIRFEQYR